MSETPNADRLTEIERQLRNDPEADLQFIRHQLMILNALLFNYTEKGVEDGLVSALVGGIDHYLDRLRGHLKDTIPTPKTRIELREIFAKVELSRYATTAKEVEDTLAHYVKENILVNSHTLTLADGSRVTAFSSRLNQTTIDGRKIHVGSHMDSKHAPVISFWEVYHRLPPQEQVLK